MFKPLKDWTMHDLVIAGWIAVILVSSLCYVVPMLWVLSGAIAYLLFGMVQMFKTGSPVILGVSGLQMVGLAAVWPLALQTKLFKR